MSHFLVPKSPLYLFFHLLLSLLLLQTVISADPLYHVCSSLGNYTKTGQFDQNYKKLITSLSSKVPPTGFGVDRFGKGHDLVNGLALCRGDVPSNDCKACVIEAGSEIRKRCPYNIEAVIWYDNCELRYSNLDFIGIIDYQYRVYLSNVQKISNPEAFNKKTVAFLNRLSAKASESPKLYATAEEKIGESQKLFGLVQCTRDLSNEGCKKCLDNAISQYPSCCDGRIGGRVIGGSCNFRYELYPFVRS